MTRFAVPTADPHGLRDAARRLSSGAGQLDGRGAAVATASGAALDGWSGAASILFLARAHSLRDGSVRAAQALEQMAAATRRFADEVEQARDEVRRLNDAWEDAALQARRQAEAAAESARRDVERARQDGEDLVRRTYDDGASALREQEAELQRRYDRANGDLLDAGFSLERALQEKDPLALLPGWAVGGITLGKAGVKAYGLVQPKGIAAARWSTLVLRTSRWYDLGRPAVRQALLGSGEYAKLQDVLTGRRVTGRFAAARTVAGKAFLPLTALTAAQDVVTGGGYGGVRGGVTRAVGAVGLGGSVALMATYAGVGLALGPVGVAVAAGAVLGYGLYSLGNLVYDNREAIGAFLGRAAGGVTDAGRWAGQQAEAAAESAGRALADGARSAVDTGRRVLDVLTSPRSLLPSFGGVF